MPSPEQRKELGAFLTSRRAKLPPSGFGLPEGRRRTPGLRREEVAVLARVSVSWYAWLEQGRDISASAETLRRVAEVLRLDRVESLHLFALASREPPRFDAGTEVTAGLLALLRAIETVPAYVRNSRLDILAWNAAVAELFVDYGTLEPHERNTLRLLFRYAPYRTLVVDWDRMARGMLETFRAARARASDRAPFDALASELCDCSDEFRRWWREHDVRSFSEGVKRLQHPTLGPLELSYTALTPEGRPELSLVTYVPRATE